MRKYQVFGIIFSVAVVSGCGEKTPAAGDSATAAQTEAQPDAGAPNGGPEGEAPPVKPVPAELPAIVANVNGQRITSAELERAVENLEASAGEEVPAEERDRVYRGVLDQLIAFELLAQEAAARKITVTDEEVTAQIDLLRKGFPDEAAFTAALKERQVSMADLEADTRRELVADKVLRQDVDPDVRVGPDEVAAFYKENSDRFRVPEQVRASHILIRVDPDADATAKQEARSRAEVLHEELAEGADFATLARKHSDDGSASTGGDLNYFPRGQMVEPFEDAAFALEVGELSGVVETPFGYHIIKVTDRKVSQVVPLDDALEGRIEQALRMGHRRERAVQLVRELREKGKVEVFL